MTRTKENDTPKWPYMKEHQVQKKHETARDKQQRRQTLHLIWEQDSESENRHLCPAVSCAVSLMGDASLRGLEENAGWPFYFYFCKIFIFPLNSPFHHCWLLQGPLYVSI